MNNKTLIITSEFPPLPGGIGNHAFLLSKYLQNNNFDISVLTNFRLSKEDLEFDNTLDFKVFRIKRNVFTQINRFQKAFNLAINNKTIICSGKFSLWIGGFLKLVAPQKTYIAVLHGSEIRAGGKMSKFLTQWSLKQFDKIIAVSGFTKEVALKFNSKLKIEVINNGFVFPKVDTISNVNPLIGNPKIITVGNVTFRKGQHNVINALPLLKNQFPEIHYHCVGLSTEKVAFMKLASTLNVENNITFHGALSTSKLVDKLKDCDVFFMLSDVLENGDFEGFGIAILEANSLSIPAIGSNNSGISDAIKQGFSGELVNPKSPEEIAHAFIKIMNNYKDYSENATSWATNFTWDKIGAKYIEIINSNA